MDVESDAPKQPAGLTDRLVVILVLSNHDHAHLECPVEKRAQTPHGLPSHERLGKLDLEEHRWGFDATVTLHVGRSPCAGRRWREPWRLGMDVPRGARCEVACERGDTLVVQCKPALKVLEPIGVADDRNLPGRVGGTIRPKCTSAAGQQRALLLIRSRDA